MCLGGGRSSKPALQERTLPAEGVKPADESTKSLGRLVQNVPLVKEDSAQNTKRNWDDVDAASPSKAQGVSNQISDSGINY